MFQAFSDISIRLGEIVLVLVVWIERAGPVYKSHYE